MNANLFNIWRDGYAIGLVVMACFMSSCQTPPAKVVAPEQDSAIIVIKRTSGRSAGRDSLPEAAQSTLIWLERFLTSDMSVYRAKVHNLMEIFEPRTKSGPPPGIKAIKNYTSDTRELSFSVESGSLLGVLSYVIISGHLSLYGNADGDLFLSENHKGKWPDKADYLVILPAPEKLGTVVRANANRAPDKE